MTAPTTQESSSLSKAAPAEKKSDKPVRKPTLAHRAEYYTMRATIAALRAMSWDAACSFGEKLGALGYRPLGIRKRVVERQIAAAFPDLGPEAVVNLARESYRHLGRTFIETALLDKLGKDGLQELVETVDGWEEIDDVMAKGKGAVMVTGHIGNWELAGAYVAARGIPLDAIVRGMANPLFDAYINHTREEIGMTVVHDSEAVRRTPRSLRAGRAVAFVADQGVMGLASTFGGICLAIRGAGDLRGGAQEAERALSHRRGANRGASHRRHGSGRRCDRHELHRTPGKVGADRARTVFLAAPQMETAAAGHTARAARPVGVT